MSHWEYEAGRKICLENMAKGDFSNDPKYGETEESRKKWIRWAKDELKKISLAVCP